MYKKLYLFINQLVLICLTVFFIGSGIISFDIYNSTSSQIDFLSEARQAATVDTATNALSRGLPWLEKHLPDTANLRVWQSNLNYLNQQPSNALLSAEIKESIDSNVSSIALSKATDWWWLVIGMWSFFLAGSIIFCFLLSY